MAETVFISMFFAQVYILGFLVFLIFSLKYILHSIAGLAGSHMRHLLKGFLAHFICTSVFIAWTIFLITGMIDLDNIYLFLISNLLFVVFVVSLILFIIRIRRFTKAFSF